MNNTELTMTSNFFQVCFGWMRAAQFLASLLLLASTLPLARAATDDLAVHTSAKPADAATAPRVLTLEQRIEYQRRIEQVLWQHRVWPKENPTPKPELSAVMPDSAIQAKVEGYVRASELLRTYWNAPISSTDLNREMNRMVQNSKAPELLRELFAALDDDPFVIAECLARPTLARTGITSAFENDSRIHAAQRTALESRLAKVRTAADLNQLGGEPAEMTYVLDDTVTNPDRLTDGDIHLTHDQWKNELTHLARNLGSAVSPAASDLLAAVPVNQVSRLMSAPGRFTVLVVREASATRLVVSSVSWPKADMAEWMASAAPVVDYAAVQSPPPSGGYLMLNGQAKSPKSPREQALGPLPTNDTWTPTPGSDTPDPRTRHTAIWTGTEMIIWGGQSAVSFDSHGGRYNPALDSWIPSAGMKLNVTNRPGPRYHHSAVWTGTEMIIWGGQSPSGSSKDGGRYNPNTDTWTPCSLTTGSGANVPEGREQHTAVWTGTEMIVWGGESPSGYVNTGGRYNPATDTWAASVLANGSATNTPMGRIWHTAVWTGSEMIIWGGQDLSLNKLNTGGRYNPTSDSWANSSLTTGTGANTPEARQEHTAVWTGTNMIIWGGFAHHYSNNGGKYDPASDTWLPCSLNTASGTNVPSYRLDHSAVWTGTEMIVWGGFPQPGDGGRYNPVTDTWAASQVSGPNAPGGRSYHTAVWTGTEMIIWGGLAYGSPLGTGGRYNPVTDSWASSVLNNHFPVEPRQLHTAVWTGSEMILWGGTFSTELATGYRYNPALDSWVSSSLTTGSGTNVPTARYAHVAVWTGTEMIIWGGFQPNRFEVPAVATGGRYNPASDTWAASSLLSTNASNVPPPAAYPTAFWTGTEMIVWGGLSGGLALNTGGRFKPATDAWQPCSLTTASGSSVPQNRHSHAAVWTGSRMVVWGGRNAGLLLNDGGIYDPSSDSWTPTSVTGAPMPRDSHTAVWTGSEMIIWGGFGQGFPNPTLNDGGRYNPLTDTWSTTTLNTLGVGTPSSRFAHTAVWTGNEMIIWGGTPNADYNALNNGGRFKPSTDSWIPSSLDTGLTLDTPLPRIGHTAIFVPGSPGRMMVWGGRTWSGGIYYVGDAPSLVVSTASDVADPSDGVTSLREALTYANSLSGPQTITFATNLAGQTITLTNGWTGMNDSSALVVSNGNITIQGPTNAPGLTLAISPGVPRRHFYLGSGGTLTLANLTLTGGSSSGYGGSVWNQFGTLAIRGCTFTGNSAALEGGAVLVWGGSPSVVIENSTFAGNTSASIAGAMDTGALTNILRNVTITANTSGNGSALVIYQNQVTLVNTLIAGNTNGDVGSVIGGGVSAASANNLVGTGGASVGLTNGVNANQVGVASASLRLGPLANNGGATPTVALLAGSPAINAGTTLAGLTTDQRGQLRPQFGAVDIGAFEQTPFDTGQTIVTAGGAFWYLGLPQTGNDWSIYRQAQGQSPVQVGGWALRIGQANDASVLVQNSVGGVYARIGSTNGIGIGWQPLATVTAGDGATWFLGADAFGNDFYVYRWATNGAPTYAAGYGTLLTKRIDGVIIARNNAGNYYLRVGSATGLGAFWQPVVLAAIEPSLRAAVAQPGGNFQFGFSNSPGANFTVFASTNLTLPLAQWTPLGAPVESPAGTYQFSDPQATNSPLRFYRVTSP